MRPGRFADELPAAPVDLVVLTEIGYYFTPAGLVDALDRLAGVMRTDALVVATHWSGTSPDHMLTSHQVHGILDRTPTLRPVNAAQRAGYLTGRYRRR